MSSRKLYFHSFLIYTLPFTILISIWTAQTSKRGNVSAARNTLLAHKVKSVHTTSPTEVHREDADEGRGFPSISESSFLFFSQYFQTIFFPSLSQYFWIIFLSSSFSSLPFNTRWRFQAVLWLIYSRFLGRALNSRVVVYLEGVWGGGGGGSGVMGGNTRSFILCLQSVKYPWLLCGWFKLWQSSFES